MNNDNNTFNYLLAIGLSVMVLIAWHFFYNIPQLERERQIAEQQAQIQAEQQAQGAEIDGSTVPTPSADGTTVPQPGGTAVPQAPDAAGLTVRSDALGTSPRIDIETSHLTGSISLRGARIDDLSLTEYRETVEDGSPIIELLSPTGTANPYYSEFGWVAADDGGDLPDRDTVWEAVSNGILTADTPIVLRHETAAGLIFTRTISVDEDYLFTISDTVENTGSDDRVLFPYGLISRHGIPDLTNFFILHEGLIGVLGEEGLVEVDYGDLAEGPQRYTAIGGWLGITDKYWATALIPPQDTTFEGRFRQGASADTPTFQADYLLAAVTLPAGGSAAVESYLFAGAKEVAIVDGYEEALGIERFELLIDWGWFYFLTKPLFYVIDFFFRMFGNFGVSILIVTVLIKLVFFPLANTAYKSMAKMKKVQPDMLEIRDRFKDDKMKQQQAMMDLYKKEKINPLAGCLPILIQIPVFFALYKVLFVTIEMRHAPFFGWIQDLSAPDPTSMFNLFGLIPWDPPTFLLIGIWPILMGITMWVQMKLNPPPPDPTQAMIFNWMPILFVFLLATFPAGLVIYWTWNNFLSVLQQGYIMKRQGVPIDIWNNILLGFGKGTAKPDPLVPERKSKTDDDVADEAEAGSSSQADTKAAEPSEETIETDEPRAEPAAQPPRQQRSRRKKGNQRGRRSGPGKPANQPGE
ncbi:MAG: membrane protein insertase YidC [Pseudomonadota bacterium]